MIIASLSVDGLTSVAAFLAAQATRATLILAAAVVAALAMKRASAATRHLVWSGAFVGVLFLPLAAALLPAWRLLPAPARAAVAPAAVAGADDGVARGAAVIPQAPPAEPVLEPISVVQATPSPSSALPRTTVTVTRGGVAAERVGWPALLVGLWIVGVALLLARLVVGTLTLRRLTRRTAPVRDARTIAAARALAAQLGIRRRVRLLVDPRATVPMTWGIVAPIVVLPAEHAEWSDDRRRLVLAHELAHVARLDGATQLVAQLAVAAFWFHPLAWFALRELRHERERACDDLVLGTGARASDYARDLVELATRLAPSPASVAAFGMARRSELEGRVLAILDPRVARGRTSRRAGMLAVVGVAALTLSAATVAPRDAIAATPRTPVGVRPTLVPREGEGSGATVQASIGQRADSAAVHDGGAASTAIAIDAPSVSAISGVTTPAVTVSAVAGDATAATGAADTVTTGPAPQADRATLLLIADAAKRISSDAEKSTLLQSVYPRYRADDGLRAAYLAVVATLTGDNARAEALLRVARADALSPTVLGQAIAIAAATASDYERGRALQALAAQPALSDPAVHRAFFDATSRIGQSSTEAAVLAAVLRRPEVTESDLLATMAAASSISSSNEAANVLVAVVRRHRLDTDALRTAFTAAARKLSSDGEYRRVMSAATISF